MTTCRCPSWTVAGIDSEDARHRLCNDAALFRTLLQRFIKHVAVDAELAGAAGDAARTAERCRVLLVDDDALRGGAYQIVITVFGPRSESRFGGALISAPRRHGEGAAIACQFRIAFHSMR